MTNIQTEHRSLAEIARQDPSVLQDAGIDLFPHNILASLQSDELPYVRAQRYEGVEEAVTAVSGFFPELSGLAIDLCNVMSMDEKKLGGELDIENDIQPEDERATDFHLDFSEYTVTAAEVPSLFLVDVDEPERYRAPGAEYRDGHLRYTGPIDPEHVYSGEPGRLVGFRKGVVHARPKGIFRHRGLLFFDFS